LPKLSYNEIHEEIKLMEWWKYERKRTIAWLYRETLL
jgi:hypothetical protein